MKSKNNVSNFRNLFYATTFFLTLVALFPIKMSVT